MIRTILLIEDDPDQREVVTWFLNEAEFRVVAVDTGPKAVEAYEIAQPDLVVLDMNMPDMGGLAVLELFRTAGILPNVVLWTAYLTPEGGREVLKQARPLGVIAYIEKDGTGQNLLRYLTELGDQTY